MAHPIFGGARVAFRPPGKAVVTGLNLPSEWAGVPRSAAFAGRKVFINGYPAIVHGVDRHMVAGHMVVGPFRAGERISLLVEWVYGSA